MRVAVASAALVAAAVLIARSTPPLRRLRRRDPPPVGGRVRVAGMAGLAACLMALALTSWGVPAVPTLVGLGGAQVFHRRRRAARLRRALREGERDDVQALRALAAELRSGLPPAEALRVAAGVPAGKGLRERMLAAAAVAAVGGDTAATLAEGSSPASPHAGLAAAWGVCQSTGGRLAAPVSRIAAAATLDLRLRREADAAMAGARASARLLAALPLAGAGLGALSGTGALTVLVSTAPGQGCLVLGAGLDLLGLAWLDRIAADRP